ncbi:MAG TPA: hypothetical protein VMS73_00760, partial [Anaerolineaceae bacterium]|nr:hypothetical protein [Anaerolineaceae bacterium]
KTKANTIRTHKIGYTFFDISSSLRMIGLNMFVRNVPQANHVYRSFQSVSVIGLKHLLYILQIYIWNERPGDEIRAGDFESEPDFYSL